MHRLDDVRGLVQTRQHGVVVQTGRDGVSLRRADERLERAVHPRLAELETSLLARRHERADVVGGDAVKAWQREDAREGHESILGEAVA